MANCSKCGQPLPDKGGKKAPPPKGKGKEITPKDEKKLPPWLQKKG